MPKGKNETGKKYGRLTVLEEAGRSNLGVVLWRCLCDCGNEVVTRGYSLRCGDTKSCGCLMKENVSKAHKIDEIGNRYSRLIVMNEAGRDKRGSVLWRCLCDCGSETTVRGIELRNGHVKSCGCLRGINNGRTPLPEGQANFNCVYSNYKRGAKRREISFELTKEDFSFLTKMNCFYCGTEPKQKCNYKNTNSAYIYNGIDRIDSNKGYTLDNVVSCCGTCNRMKMDMNSLEFKEHIKRIYEYRIQTTKEFEGEQWKQHLI